MPWVVYVWVGRATVEVEPSPKSQIHDVGTPVLRSMNVVATGALPVVGDAVKLATGGPLAATTSKTKLAWRSGSPTGRNPPSTTKSWSPTRATPRGSTKPYWERSKDQPGTTVHVVVDTRYRTLRWLVTRRSLPSPVKCMPLIAVSTPGITMPVPIVLVA